MADEPNGNKARVWAVLLSFLGGIIGGFGGSMLNQVRIEQQLNDHIEDDSVHMDLEKKLDIFYLRTEGIRLEKDLHDTQSHTREDLRDIKDSLKTMEEYLRGRG
jgi:hypothetical protein